MTTEYKLNQLIEWTDEDRAKGECPVPDGSNVTVWLSDGRIKKDEARYWNWTDCNITITAYLIHSVPREPIVRWMVVGSSFDGLFYSSEDTATVHTDKYGGRVVKMVEVTE